MAIEIVDFPIEKWVDLSRVMCMFTRGQLVFDNGYINCLVNVDTSSTAQGGGGRVKNRKPIGEVGCCESRMAE